MSAVASGRHRLWFWPHNRGLKHTTFWFPLLAETRWVLQEALVSSKGSRIAAHTGGEFDDEQQSDCGHEVSPHNRDLKYAVFWNSTAGRNAVGALATSTDRERALGHPP
ncbi:hypothetical protein M427DRAFT_30046 [Gonapodya prolifera JEL478]|uniref:Uncharacterized protein n=1 Tax=Gonapodya prolifera (strain JEL478) TaxID=1344416 RepID=A0A139AME1_GONPJ|nr:hypothetical protein M427DRAFT_30046 [Gonapodya prolifera JEL478]|eukprot:KXS17919.1 hypothetical protein M427DRAFT_30046 [Gonapodya prolifera JEL478]